MLGDAEVTKRKFGIVNYEFGSVKFELVRVTHG